MLACRPDNISNIPGSALFARTTCKCAREIKMQLRTRPNVDHIFLGERPGIHKLVNPFKPNVPKRTLANSEYLDQMPQI